MSWCARSFSYQHIRGGRRVVSAKGARWGLVSGDMLVVSTSVPDMHALDTLDAPFTAIFFRSKQDSGISGVSILWNIPGVHEFGILGCEISYLCDCTLHTIDLGVAQHFVAIACVVALNANIYNVSGPRGHRLRLGALRMSAAINQYYKRERKANRWKPLSMLRKKFNINVLGPS